MTLKRMGCMALVILPLGFILWGLWSQLFVHDWLLWQLRRQYARVQHPASTQRVKYYHDLGLLIGNGNHCDIFVGELRSFTGSRQQLLQRYASHTYLSPISRQREPVELLFIENGKLIGGNYNLSEIDIYVPSPLERILKDVTTVSTPEKQLYIVFMFDSGYDAGIDIRCQ